MRYVDRARQLRTNCGLRDVLSNQLVVDAIVELHSQSVGLDRRPRYSVDQAQQIFDELGLPFDRQDNRRDDLVRRVVQAKRQFYGDLELQKTPSRSKRITRMESMRSTTVRLLDYLEADRDRDIDVNPLRAVPISIKVDLALGAADLDLDPSVHTSPDLDLERLIPALQDISRVSDAARGAIEREDNPGRGGDALDAFILRLIDIYEEATGKQAGLSRQYSAASKPGGPLFRWLRLCIDPLFTEPSDNHRGKLVPVGTTPPSDEALASRLRRLLTMRRGKSE